MFVEDREARVEIGAPKSNAFHFSRKSLSLLQLDCKAIDVLALDDSRNSRIERNFLSFGVVVVGFGFFADWIRSDEERAQLRKAARRSHAQMMLSQRTVRGNFYLRFGD